MTDKIQGKRWPPTAGVEADYITVDADSDGGAVAAVNLRSAGIPHTTVAASAPKPPVLEGWSFSVYSGAEEHASGWGSASLADMAPALLAALGMTDAATANRSLDAYANERVELRHVLSAERGETPLAAATRVADDISRLREDLAIATAQLDKVYDLLGKVCVAVGDGRKESNLLAAVQGLVSDLAAANRKIEAAERSAWTDAHAAVRLDLVLARWEALAYEVLPKCPQLDNALGVVDIRTRHSELRSLMKGEISVLRGCVSKAADREAQIIDALGVSCATDEIAEEVENVVKQRDAAREVIAAVAHAVECPSGVHNAEHAAEVALRLRSLAAENASLRNQSEGEIAASNQWEAAARKAWAYGEQIGRVLPVGNPNEGLLERATALASEADGALAGEADLLRDQVASLQDAETRTLCRHYQQRATTMTEEVTRLNRVLENTGGYGARERVKVLTRENEGLRAEATTLREDAEAWKTTARAWMECYNAKAQNADSLAKLSPADYVRFSERLDQWVVWGRRAACVVDADDDTLRSEIDKALPMWRRGAPQV